MIETVIACAVWPAFSRESWILKADKVSGGVPEDSLSRAGPRAFWFSGLTTQKTDSLSGRADVRVREKSRSESQLERGLADHSLDGAAGNFPSIAQGRAYAL